MSDVFVYTYVPREALKSIAKHGLLSGDVLYRNPKLLKLARPEADARQEWIERYEELEDDPEMNIVFKGPSVFFTKAYKPALSPEHYINKWKLVAIRINITNFINDHPDTKVLGVELIPFDEGMSDGELDIREHYLTLDEIEEYSSTSPAELWQYYNGDPKFYAADVPHAIVIAPQIQSKYIEI